MATAAVPSRQVVDDVVQLRLLLHDMRLSGLAHVLTVALMVTLVHGNLGLVVEALDEVIVLLLALLGILFALRKGRILDLHFLGLVGRDICVLLPRGLRFLVWIFGWPGTGCPCRASIFVHLLPVAFNLVVGNLRNLFENHVLVDVLDQAELAESVRLLRLVEDVFHDDVVDLICLVHLGKSASIFALFV